MEQSNSIDQQRLPLLIIHNKYSSINDYLKNCLLKINEYENDSFNR